MDDLNQFINDQLADPEFARRYVLHLESEVERQRSIADTAWRKMDDAINERTGKHLQLLAERALADQLHNALCLAAVNLSGRETAAALAAYREARRER